MKADLAELKPPTSVSSHLFASIDERLGSGGGVEGESIFSICINIIYGTILLNLFFFFYC